MVSDRCEPSEGVRWFPAPDEDELDSLLARAWALCLPSTYEGFGIPYLEAMAHGTPVVASPNPGARYVLDGGRAGLVVEDVELAGALVRCLTDRELRASLSARGRERAADFAWPRVLAAHEAAYREAITAVAERGDAPTAPRRR
jgi:glycosyltransferase involved in cell wall biosynthesis